MAHIVSKDDAELESVIELSEKFCMGLYGKLTSWAKLLDDVCEIMYKLQRYISISRMPPVISALCFPCYRHI